MELIAPSGPVYQAGTLSGNPLAMAAGIASLKTLKEMGLWEKMNLTVDELTAGIAEAAKGAGVQIQQNRVGTMFATFFTETPVHDWTTAKNSDTQRFGRFFQSMLEQGIYLAPSQFEAGFISSVHNQETTAATVNAASKAMKSS